MNQYDEKLMKAPSLMPAGANVSDCECVFCHRRATNAHHIVKRSQGGSQGPLVPVCGFGNASGCHGLLHASKIYMRYTDRWEYFVNFDGISYHDALNRKDWREIHQ